MKTLSRLFCFTAVLAALAVASVSTGQSQGAAAGDIEQPLQLKPITPDDERLTGLVKPSKKVSLMAPLEGLIKKINVDEDDSVKEGDVLAVMDDELQIVQVEAARLEVDRRAALLEEAKLQVDQAKRLLEKKAIGDFELRQRELQQTGAQIDLDRAKSSLDLEQLRLDRYKIKAPFDGRILQLGVEEGATVSNNRSDDVIIYMIALNPLEAQMFLPVQLYGELQIGKEYTFYAGPPVNRTRKTVIGKLKSVEPQIEPASQTFRCVFTIDNPDEQLPSGFTVRLAWPQP